MNERIKELREQAADFASQTYSKYTMATFNTNKSIETLFEEKFAELIVRECAEVIQDSPWQLGHECTPSEQASLIKEHFGVED